MPNVLRPFWRLIVLFCKFYGIFAFHSAKIYVTRPPSISEKKIAGSNFSCTFMHSTLKSENKLQKKCTYNSRVVYPTRVCQEIKLTSLKQLKKNRFFLDFEHAL